jgi:ketosteroid isomerase-like protein
MKKLTIFLAAAVVSLGLAAAAPSLGYSSNDPELDAINKLIDRYAAAESAGDMRAQGALMTDDRIWVNPRRGRRLNNVLNMQIQQAQADARSKAAPGLRLFVEDRERIIRFVGGKDAAVASFYRFYAAVVPENAPADIKAEYGKAQAPELMTLVLEKRGADWKIVYTHTSHTWD